MNPRAHQRRRIFRVHLAQRHGPGKIRRRSQPRRLPLFLFDLREFQHPASRGAGQVGHVHVQRVDLAGLQNIFRRRAGLDAFEQRFAAGARGLFGVPRLGPKRLNFWARAQSRQSAATGNRRGVFRVPAADADSRNSRALPAARRRARSNPCRICSAARCSRLLAFRRNRKARAQISRRHFQLWRRRSGLRGERHQALRVRHRRRNGSGIRRRGGLVGGRGRAVSQPRRAAHFELRFCNHGRVRGQRHVGGQHGLLLRIKQGRRFDWLRLPQSRANPRRRVHAQPPAHGLRHGSPLRDVRHGRKNLRRLRRCVRLDQSLSGMRDLLRRRDNRLPRMICVGSQARFLHSDSIEALFRSLTRRQVRQQVPHRRGPGDGVFSRRWQRSALDLRPGEEGKYHGEHVPDGGNAQRFPGRTRAQPAGAEKWPHRPAPGRRGSMEQRQQARPEILAARLPRDAQVHPAPHHGLPQYQSPRHAQSLYSLAAGARAALLPFGVTFPVYRKGFSIRSSSNQGDKDIWIEEKSIAHSSHPG